MQQNLLPLFPLKAVLLPGGQLPLHIFEERYREMIGEARRDKSDFGVILANETGLANTGCTAAIDQVLREYPDGRLDILTVGRRRFEVQMLNEERSFLRGTVEYFDDEDESPVDPRLREEVIRAFLDFQTPNSGGLSSEQLASNQLSFRLAEAVEDLTVRQDLLAERSEAARIRKLAGYLPDLAARERHSRQVKSMAPRNGHSKLPGGIH